MKTTDAGQGLEIERMLVLSTAHVTLETSIEFEDGDVGSHKFVSSYGFGCWVRPSAEDLDYVNAPEDLEVVLKFAQRYDCRWVRFDTDGPRIPGLPLYSWEVE
jgi:hypothetical protein